MDLEININEDDFWSQDLGLNVSPLPHAYRENIG